MQLLFEKSRGLEQLITMRSQGGARLWVIIGVLLCIIAPGQIAAATTYADISALELKQRIDDSKDHGFVIIDVRSVQEYNEGHIVDAQSIPLQTFGYRVYSLDKSKDMIVYCGYGVQSKIACQILINTGFKDVYNLTGGLQTWPYGLEPTDGRINV